MGFQGLGEVSVKAKVSTVVGGFLISAAVASAQTAQPPARNAQLTRYQIGQMERLLEGAVEHGVALVRVRLQSVMPADTMTMLLGENARVRGFQLEGYGVFFDVEVPSMQPALLWSVRTLDQNALGLDSALKELRAHIDATRDINLQQALKRVELQVTPLAVASTAPSVAGAQAATGAPSVVPAGVDAAAAPDPILNDPNEAYRSEVRRALMDAMLDYGASLSIGADEWLTIAARGNYERPRLAPADSDARTMIMRVRGADLAAFQSRQVSKDDAMKRVEVRMF